MKFVAVVESPAQAPNYQWGLAQDKVPRVAQSSDSNSTHPLTHRNTSPSQVWQLRANTNPQIVTIQLLVNTKCTSVKRVTPQCTSIHPQSLHSNPPLHPHRDYLDSVFTDTLTLTYT
jgi:hypothetical protein